MFECLAGRPPFIGATTLDTMRLHAKAEPPFIEECNKGAYFPEELESIVRTCLAKQPDERFQSAEALEDALLDLQADFSTDDSSERKSDSEIKPGAINAKPAMPRSKMSRGLLVAVLFLLLAVLVVPYFKPVREPIQPAPVRALKQPDRRLLHPSNIYNEPERRSSLRSVSTLFKVTRSRFAVDYQARENDITDSEIAGLKGSDATTLFLGDQPFITDGACETLSHLNLTFLDIRQCEKITDKGLALLCKIKSLQTLCLSSASIRGSSFDQLPSKLNGLLVSKTLVNDTHLHLLNPRNVWDGLDLSETYVTDAGLPSLSKLRIRALHLTACHVSDDGMPGLAANKTVSHLFIGSTRLTSKGVIALKPLPLVVLNVDHCKGVDDRCLKELPVLFPKLEELCMMNTSITSAGLKYLKGLKALRRLRISLIPWTDEDLQSIYSLKKLEHIDLTQSDITDKTLERIARLPKMKELVINGCTRLSADGITRARKEIPRIEANLAGLSIDELSKGVDKPSSTLFPPPESF